MSGRNGNPGSSSASPSVKVKLITTDRAEVKLKSATASYMAVDNHGVCWNPKGDSLIAKWTVETVQGTTDKILLKSYSGRYLTAAAADDRVLLTEKATDKAKESMQTWKPSKDENGVKLEMSGKPGFFLKADGVQVPLSIVQHRPEDTTTPAIRWFPADLSPPLQDQGRT